MSILTNQGFDEFVFGAAKALQAILSAKRTKGLDSISKALKKANLENLSETNARSFALDLQVPLLASSADSIRITKETAKQMKEMSDIARKEAVEQWKLSAKSELPNDDKRHTEISENTAGLFLLERDAALAIRVADRFAKAFSSQAKTKNKSSKSDSNKPESDSNTTQKSQKQVFKAQTKQGPDPFSFFWNAWGKRAEIQYWTLVSGAWMGRARNQSIAASFSDSGMEWCKIFSQIDDRTTHVCRLLHGKRILVSSVEAVSAGLVAPTTTGNWISEIPPPPIGGLTADTEKPVLLMPPLEEGGKPRILARRTEEHKSGTGEFDMGKYDQFITDEELSKTLGPPPYHFLCRTILVPDDFQDPLNLQAEVTQAEIPKDLETFVNQQT